MKRGLNLDFSGQSRWAEYLKPVLEEGKVRGGEIFDAFLVAQMRACGISSVCTYNTKDFSKYKGIIAHTPESLGF